MENSKIDFVMLWVDSSDSNWRKEYCDFTGKKDVSELNRYRDWGFLKYWFRSIEKYAPWVNKIYLVTNGQTPSFLDKRNPKVEIISHREIIDERYLPLYNSSAIELNIYKIRGLSEQFVYFNDDMLLIAPTQPSDFFYKGLPCDCAILDMVIPMGNDDVYYHMVLNDVDIINKYYNKKRVTRNNLWRWYNVTYTTGFIRNVCLSPWKYFAGFKTHHLESSFLKSSFEEMAKREPAAFERTFQSHFRGYSDVNQYLIRYYQLCEGLFYPRRKKGRYFEIGPQTEEIVNAIKDKKYKSICMNDVYDEIDFEYNKNFILSALEMEFSEKSSFEI